MSEISVRVSGLVKSFGQHQALRGVDFEARPGEIFGLLGPNGAGKTTTLRVIGTLLRPDAGHAEVLGLDVVAKPDAVRARLGWVPQELVSDRTLTGRENLELFCDLYHLPLGEHKGRISALLELVGLAEHADRRVRTYSGGMRKKLDLACGLVHEPPVLVLDEPSLGLDVPTRRTLWDHLLQLKQRGVTMLLSTNSMEEADQLCDRLAVIDAGRVAVCGAPEELKSRLGGDVLSLSFRSDPGVPGELPAALSAVELVKHVVVDGLRVDVTVESSERALAPVLQATREAGGVVAEARFMRPGLEAVFLEATGHSFDRSGEVPA